MTVPERFRVVVRPASRDDLDRMAAWQCSFVPQGLFPRLGKRFVRHWHTTFLDSPFGIALIAELISPQSPPMPVGFLIGSTDQVRHVDDVVRRNRFRLGIAGAAALAVRPRLAAHFLQTRAIAYGRRLLRPAAVAEAGSDQKGSGINGPMDRPGIAVITAIAVAPEARGCGAGKDLISRFLDQVRAAGALRAELVVVTGSSGPEAFYTRLGWTPVGEHLSKDGSHALTFRYPLDGEATE
ncbi:MAG: GNAT family N-acetyltransferase [Actinomycetota bacterium]